MPPAAKGSNPLWKPYLGVRLPRICGSFSLSETLAAIDNDKTAVLQYVSQNGTSAPPAILTYSLKGRAK